MNVLYRESPVMFPAEPLRFSLTVIVLVAGLVLAALYSWLFYPGLIAAGVAGLMLVWWAIVNTSTVVTVDDERITYRRGVFDKSYIEVELGTIRSVRVDQSLIDRIFGCGHLKVISVGDLADITQDGLPGVTRLRAALRTARSRG